ncbi:MAG: UDP-N-acetylmuramoyl-tripeptide--D-alanyl-D-alanine ligase [Erysipelotrichaceae bacterium]
MKQTCQTIQGWLELQVVGASDSNALITNVAIDSRTIQAGGLYVPLPGANTDGHKFIEQAIANGAVACFWNRNEPNPPKDIFVLLCDNVQIELQRLAFLYRQQLSAKLIGVTGSNGKTSVKDMLMGMLSLHGKTQKTQGNYNNELGVPLTLLQFDEDIAYGIVEMGMEQAGEIAFLSAMVQPDYAIITNVGNAHVENLGGLEQIAKAKLEITTGLKPKGTIWINGLDEHLIRQSQEMDLSDFEVIYYGNQEPYQIHNFTQDEKGIRFDTGLYPTILIPMLGAHQALNALGALGVCKAEGVAFEPLQKGVLQMEATGLRNELLHLGDCMILNDSYKSNPESAIAALRLFDQLPAKKRIVILADMLDLGEASADLHRRVGRAMESSQIDVVVTYGEMARYIGEAAKPYVGEVISFEDKAELISYVVPWAHETVAILVKGSRGMRLEEVVAAMKEEVAKNGKN